MVRKIKFLTTDEKEKRRIDKNLKNKIWRQNNPDKYKAQLERAKPKIRAKWKNNEEFRLKGLNRLRNIRKVTQILLKKHIKIY